MTNDTYHSFDELKKCQTINKDYRIAINNVGSHVTIIAPHGGKIEPRTSDLAKMIAQGNYNYYCFEGIKKTNNALLHITSHRFDEPIAIRILSTSKIVISIHACKGNSGFVHLGGLDIELKKILDKELQAKGIRTSTDHPSFLGLNPDNICNRGATGKGVQLEITRDLRDDLAKVNLISKAVKKALNQYCNYFPQTNAQPKGHAKERML